MSYTILLVIYMKIKKDEFGNYYLIMKDKDKLTILANKSIKSKIVITCINQNLSINFEESKKKDNLEK